MTTQQTLETEVATLIVESLSLEDVSPEDIDPDAPLFGDGLGLDSIDALELALAISAKYGFKLKAEDENNKSVFATLGSLSAHIASHRAA